MKGYKAFDQNMKCRDFQYEIGKVYKHDGDVKMCGAGFHFCEYPLDVQGYYAPATAIFAEIDASGTILKDGDESICSELKIVRKLTALELNEAAKSYILERVEKEKKQSNSGNQSSASNSGNQSSASNSGDWSSASNSGYQSSASNSGDWSSASNSGDYSSASNSGKEGCAVSLGIEAKAQGALGCFLTLAEWKEVDGRWHRITVVSKKVDGKKIKPDTWYQLENGKFVEPKP